MKAIDQLRNLSPDDQLVYQIAILRDSVLEVAEKLDALNERLDGKEKYDPMKAYEQLADNIMDVIQKTI